MDNTKCNIKVSPKQYKNLLLNLFSYIIVVSVFKVFKEFQSKILVNLEFLAGMNLKLFILARTNR
jgi:hypothetical protein